MAVIVFTSHAKLRMKDRGISEFEVHGVLESPVEVISVRYGRFAAFGKFGDKKLVVIYEGRDDTNVVVTALWVDDRRLKAFGFTRI